MPAAPAAAAERKARGRLPGAAPSGLSPTPTHPKQAPPRNTGIESTKSQATHQRASKTSLWKKNFASHASTHAYAQRAPGRAALTCSPRCRSPPPPPTQVWPRPLPRGGCPGRPLRKPHTHRLAERAQRLQGPAAAAAAAAATETAAVAAAAAAAAPVGVSQTGAAKPHRPY